MGKRREKHTSVACLVAASREQGQASCAISRRKLLLLEMPAESPLPLVSYGADLTKFHSLTECKIRLSESLLSLEECV